jgi:hypothetical protein
VWLSTYLSGSDGHLDLTTGSGHDLAELLADTTEDAKTVVLGEGIEEVLDGGRVGAARMVDSLASFSTREPRLARARAVGSRLEDLTAAVYCEMTQGRLVGCPFFSKGLAAMQFIASRACLIILSDRSTTYQSAGVGSVNAKDSNRGLGLSGGSVGPRGHGLEGEGALGRDGPDGADGLAGEHDCRRDALGPRGKDRGGGGLMELRGWIDRIRWRDPGVS